MDDSEYLDNDFADESGVSHGHRRNVRDPEKVEILSNPNFLVYRRERKA
jgi:hypothetical protein